MSGAQEQRGGAPIGYLSDLDPVEAASIVYLRLWCNGPEARRRVYQDFFGGLGEKHGEHALASFEHLCDLLARFGRRPLMRHSVGCTCLGSDEACFANFIATAAEGEREDATLIATFLVRPDVSPILTDMAQTFGLALKRMGLAVTEVVSDQPGHHRMPHHSNLLH